ncbi:poly(3-hydroxyalkanoate) depolymerase [Flexivirga caeni]|uniref:Poly(3-hydroxyalkanoate) depolymerase n=1 Tax=Flexivirga caeni TaxID=2294115 RepID=A0A3M9M1G0_9MICO|nr:poly(3-hydroxyalkanoate) depolymerase [Flexivirga caeni]RNI18985.1 poly(3-hydroxyalkanoate) depolymerase [Flexivirga caeni]
MNRAHATTLRQVDVGGQWVRVAVRPGTQDGPPLVLCNGIGASLEILQPFVDRLDPRIEVVAFDVPGVGGSPLPRLPYNFPLLARFVGRMLDSLGYERFDVLGISWGGALAQQLAFQFPRRCRRAVLAATAAGFLMVPASPAVLWKLTTPRRHRDAEFAVDNAAELYGGRLRREPELAARVLHRESRAGSRRGYLYQLLAGAGWTSLPALPLIRQPVLILAGNDDPIIPLANARAMHRLLPHSTLYVYDDGHLGLVTMAEELAPIIGEFLRDEQP